MKKKFSVINFLEHVKVYFLKHLTLVKVKIRKTYAFIYLMFIQNITSIIKMNELRQLFTMTAPYINILICSM